MLTRPPRVESAIEFLNKYSIFYEYKTAMMNISDYILDLEEYINRTGHWVYDPDGMDWGLPAWKCSECHNKNDMIPTHFQGKEGKVQVKNPYAWAGSRYCPCCGIRMIPKEEEANVKQERDS